MASDNYQAQVEAYSTIQQLQAQYNAEYAQGNPNYANTWQTLQQWITYYNMLQHTAAQQFASAS